MGLDVMNLIFTKPNIFECFGNLSNVFKSLQGKPTIHLNNWVTILHPPKAQVPNESLLRSTIFCK